MNHVWKMFAVFTSCLAAQAVACGAAGTTTGEDNDSQEAPVVRVDSGIEEPSPGDETPKKKGDGKPVDGSKEGPPAKGEPGPVKTCHADVLGDGQTCKSAAEYRSAVERKCGDFKVVSFGTAGDCANGGGKTAKFTCCRD